MKASYHDEQYFPFALLYVTLLKVLLNFECVDDTPKYHSNESYWTEIFFGAHRFIFLTFESIVVKIDIHSKATQNSVSVFFFVPRYV